MRSATTCSSERAAAPAAAAAATRLLVVEDSALIRRRLVDSIAALGGYDVVCAETAAEALSAIAQQMPEVVITDIRLREGSGIDVVRHLRARAGGPRPRIYVLTNYALAEYREQCALLGVDDFFDKSSEYGRLFETLRDGA